MGKEKLQVEQKVLDALNNIALQEVDLCTALFEGVLDSFDLVVLITDIEERFGLSVPIEDVNMENFKDGNTIVSFVQKLTGA